MKPIENIHAILKSLVADHLGVNTVSRRMFVEPLKVGEMRPIHGLINSRRKREWRICAMLPLVKSTVDLHAQVSKQFST